MPPFARARPIWSVYNFWDRHHWVLDAHGKTPGEHWVGIKNTSKFHCDRAKELESRRTDDDFSDLHSSPVKFLSCLGESPFSFYSLCHSSHSYTI